MLNNIRRRLKAGIFNKIRPFVVSDIDSNEDFICGSCGGPVLLRELFCSDRCALIFQTSEMLDIRQAALDAAQKLYSIPEPETVSTKALITMILRAAQIAQSEVDELSEVLKGKGNEHDCLG